MAARAFQIQYQALRSHTAAAAAVRGQQRVLAVRAAAGLAVLQRDLLVRLIQAAAAAADTALELMLAVKAAQALLLFLMPDRKYLREVQSLLPVETQSIRLLRQAHLRQDMLFHI